MTTPEPDPVRLTSRQIRILAHPLRVRLLGALREAGSATATRLAELLDTNTGATSYHLRQLAEVGLVVEDPDRAVGRQRWWRAAHEYSSWQATAYDDDPDARAAAEWMQGEQLRILAERADGWRAVQAGYDQTWRDAAGISDALLRISPQRLDALHAELWAVLERYRAETPSDEPDALPVAYFLAAFPKVGVRR
ncbi:ArsR family transcriptional regulator [Micromonospora rosaria]|uniref:ArsR family transcriptional regulator n=1 Tax=Micromonospora rosaria TaxID=47874 RepID=A0A136PQ41_9ACTN|nr:helix-turn-helix domain-containing protein [Micromonospora rosaria]KXK60457.1 ArsR family transcriptional regulator [Micromonospora rosaria]